MANSSSPTLRCPLSTLPFPPRRRGRHLASSSMATSLEARYTRTNRSTRSRASPNFLSSRTAIIMCTTRSSLHQPPPHPNQFQSLLQLNRLPSLRSTSTSGHRKRRMQTVTPLSYQSTDDQSPRLIHLPRLHRTRMQPAGLKRSKNAELAQNVGERRSLTTTAWSWAQRFPRVTQTSRRRITCSPASDFACLDATQKSIAPSRKSTSANDAKFRSTCWALS